MSSNAFTNHLLQLLRDPEELLDAQIQLLALPGLGGQWGIGALNRAAIVMFIASWEAYIEHVAVEAVEALRPAGPLGNWPALYASVQGWARQLHTPDVQNVRRLISGSIGLADITASWAWSGVTVTNACQQLNDALTIRNQIAHEMDVNFKRKGPNRNPRRRREMVEHTNQILQAADALLAAVDARLSEGRM